MKKYIIFDLDGTLISSKAFLMREIFNYFEQKYPEYLDTLRYKLDYNTIGDFNDLINSVFGETLDSEKVYQIKEELYEIINNNVDNIGFISGTLEQINKIKNDFILFLSTGNSTNFAKEILKKGHILQYFELVIGGDLIPKTIEHVEMMKDHMNDDNFYSNAIFVGDGPRDREIAETKGIKYIRIGDKIESIAQVDFYSI